MSICYPYVIPAAAAASEDAATTAWVAAVVSAGGTVSSTQRGRVDALIVGLKADSLFTELDRLWLYGGESISQQAAIDIIALATATLGGSPNPTLSASGYTGDATNGFIDTGFNPLSAAGNYAVNDCSYGVYVQARAANQNWEDIGCSTGAQDTRILLKASFSAAALAWDIMDPTGVNFGTTNTDAKGCYVISRTGSTTSAIYKNSSGTAVETSAHTGHGTRPNQNFYVCGTNSSGALQNPSGDTVSASFIGGGLTSTQAANLMTRINTYMTAWGIHVY